MRQATPTGVPVLAEAKAMIASYRIAFDADVDTLALTLIGSGHMLFVGREGVPPEAEAVGKVVTTVVAGVVQEPRR